MEVTRLVIEDNGGRCSTGWLTLASGDGGYDFVLKTTLGTNDLARLQIIMLGQAKCEKLTGHVNGKDIARLVARLIRGWVGAFVTILLPLLVLCTYILAPQSAQHIRPVST